MPPQKLKLNNFNFKCSDCKCSYSDSSYDLALESECPKCGKYNYKETAQMKNINKEKTKEAKKKIIMEML